MDSDENGSDDEDRDESEGKNERYDCKNQDCDCV